jgi:hypothetical protein
VPHTIKAVDMVAGVVADVVREPHAVPASTTPSTNTGEDKEKNLSEYYINTNI